VLKNGAICYKLVDNESLTPEAVKISTGISTSLVENLEKLPDTGRRVYYELLRTEF
jgi:hypothetical protein